MTGCGLTVGTARFEDLDQDGADAAACAVDEDAVARLGIGFFEYLRWD
jgi:hypothetical protein